MCTLRPPRADMATMNGIIHDITPNTLSPKVCKVYHLLTIYTSEKFLLSGMGWPHGLPYLVGIVFTNSFLPTCMAQSAKPVLNPMNACTIIVSGHAFCIYGKLRQTIALHSCGDTNNTTCNCQFIDRVDQYKNNQWGYNQFKITVGNHYCIIA